MKKPHEIKEANPPIIVDLGAYSMIYPQDNTIRLATPGNYETDSLTFPTEEAAAAEFARIRAALFGEEHLKA